MKGMNISRTVLTVAVILALFDLFVANQTHGLPMHENGMHTVPLNLSRLCVDECQSPRWDGPPLSTQN